MKTGFVSFVCVCLLAIVAPAALAEWSETFDTYTPGSGLHGRGGCEGWNGNSAADAVVSSGLFLTAPHSVEIAGAADVVRQFSGCTSGSWVITAWQYIPADFSGVTNLLLLNAYGAGNWNPFRIRRLCRPAPARPVDRSPDRDRPRREHPEDLLQQGAALPEELDGRHGHGGAVNIAALDLYAENATAVYYDNLSLKPAADVPVVRTTWGSLKAGGR